MMTHVLYITDMCIKEEVHLQNNPNSTRDTRQNVCSVVGRQSITFLN